MKMRKIVLLTYVTVFVLILAIPIVTFNRIPGRISAREKRALATFPAVFDEEGHLNSNLKSDFETWLGDNLGLRSSFVDLATDVRLKLFHQSTNGQVELGWDGWLFYTPDHNIELASGEYVLTQEQLKEIAENQQQVNDWYQSQGIKYLLVLDAAKPSVYPEYIASRDCGVRNTICDQVEQYLKENTTVQVLNTKTALLEEKAQSGKLLYFKTDTHWTQWGSYIVYKAVAEKLTEMGFDMKQFEVQFHEGEIDELRDLPSILGASDNLGELVTEYASWESNAKRSEDESVYGQYRVANEMAEPVVMENESAKNGTVLIYGESSWEPKRNIPQLLGESFQTVVSMWCYDLYHMDVDELAKPEVVICGVGERLLDGWLTQKPNLPKLVGQIPNLPVKEAVDVRVKLDTYNGHPTDDTNISVTDDSATLELIGWAADFNDYSPFAGLYLKVGEKIFECNYGGERKDVADYYSNEQLIYTGFQITIPVKILDNELQELQFFGVSADGQYIFQPVKYILT